MIPWNGTATARHPAGKTELSLCLKHRRDKVGTCPVILCSVPALTFLGILSQLEVAVPSPSTATSCSACAAEWWPCGPLWWLVFVCCCRQSLMSQSSLDLSLGSSVWVNSLYALWESCGLSLCLDQNKVFLTALSWCSSWLPLELLLFVALWALYPLCIILLGEYEVHWCWMGEASTVLMFFLHHWG